MTQTLAPPPPAVRRVAEPPARRTRTFTRPLQYLALLAYMVFLGFPLLFLLSTSLKTPRELQSTDPSFLPESLNWANFSNAVEKANLAQAAGNSLYVAALTTIIVTVVSLPAAYALARFRTKLRVWRPSGSCSARCSRSSSS